MEKQMTLRDLREQSGKSRAEVANALHVSYRAVSNYEAGIREISIEQVISLAKLFDCGAEEVIMAQLESIRIGKPE